MKVIYVSVCGNIFIMCSIVLNIGLLAYYFAHFEETKGYIKYSMVFIVIYFVIEVAAFVSSDALSHAGTSIDIISDVISALKIIIYSSTGIYCCEKMGIKDIPVVRRFMDSEYKEKIYVSRYLIDTFSVVFGALVFSFILFKVTTPKTSSFAMRFFGSRKGLQFSDILIFIEFVLSEEIVFRMAAQNLIAKVFKLYGKKYWISIVCASLLWTLGHANTLNPEWVKFVQIFPIGIALGWLYRKHGAESSLLAHAAFNIIMAFIGAGLIIS